MIHSMLRRLNLTMRVKRWKGEPTIMSKRQTIRMLLEKAEKEEKNNGRTQRVR